MSSIVLKKSERKRRRLQKNTALEAIKNIFYAICTPFALKCIIIYEIRGGVSPNSTLQTTLLILCTAKSPPLWNLSFSYIYVSLFRNESFPQSFMMRLHAEKPFLPEFPLDHVSQPHLGSLCIYGASNPGRCIIPQEGMKPTWWCYCSCWPRLTDSSVSETGCPPAAPAGHASPHPFHHPR